MITITEILQSEKINQAAKDWALENLEYLNRPMKFFGSSVKVEKGADKFDTYVMYLQPADKVAVKTLCTGANAAGCKPACLISSGQLGMSVAQNAATKRTILFLLKPEETLATISAEIDKAEEKALKTGTPALFRLNGTSDEDFADFIASKPESIFYDYTKVLSRVRKNSLPNYDLTYSGSMYSQQSKSALVKAVNSGFRIAIAFNTKNLKDDALDIPVGLISFDKTDLRHLDAKGVIGTLTRKGSNKLERAKDNLVSKSFFVTAANLTEFNNIIARG